MACPIEHRYPASPAEKGDTVNSPPISRTWPNCDTAASGASRLRPAYQKLLEDARGGFYHVVVAEALDRPSRDQEDVAALYKGGGNVRLFQV